MTIGPLKTNVREEICSMCKRLKKKHTHEELLACARKMEEFRNKPEGGAGIL